jgi:hypothetical protein
MMFGGGETMHELPLYDRDFFSWTQAQARELRALRGPNRLDTQNLAQEVEDLGRAELRATQHAIERCLEHLLKLAASPAQAPVGRWRRESRTFAKHARRAFSPGMRQHLDMAVAWQEAVKAANDDLSDYGEAPVDAQTACPFALDALLAENFDVDAAVSRVRQPL